MKDQDPFNPAMPAEFNLLTEGAPTEPGQQASGSSADPLGEGKAKRKSNRSARQSAGSAGARKKKKSKISWQQMKEKLNAKLGSLDKEKLKTVLTACGIAAGVVLAVIIAVKMVPIAVLLLALLGLAGVIRIWDRLRRPPEPM